MSKFSLYFQVVASTKACQTIISQSARLRRFFGILENTGFFKKNVFSVLPKFWFGFFSRTAPAYNRPNLSIIFHEPTNVVIPNMSISQRQEFGQPSSYLGWGEAGNKKGKHNSQICPFWNHFWPSSGPRFYCSYLQQCFWVRLLYEFRTKSLSLFLKSGWHMVCAHSHIFLNSL